MANTPYNINATKRTLQIEAPTKAAVVDFLSEQLAVMVQVEGDELSIHVEVTQGETPQERQESSTWSEREYTLSLSELRGDA